MKLEKHFRVLHSGVNRIDVIYSMLPKDSRFVINTSVDTSRSSTLGANTSVCVCIMYSSVHPQPSLLYFYIIVLQLLQHVLF